MSDESNFKLLETINRGSSVAFVGEIEGNTAIMYAWHPGHDEENLNKYISTEHFITSRNDIYQSGEITIDYEMNYRLVYPVSPEEVSMLKAGNKYVVESYDEYLVRRNLIPEGYVDRLLADPQKRERTKVFYEDDEFLVVAKEGWNGNVGQLGMILIVKDDRYVTIRDVESIGQIQKVRELSYKICDGLDIERCMVVIYCDARPMCRHLHFNIQNISINCFYFPFSGWPLLIDDILKNLSHTVEYYKKDVFYLAKKIDENQKE
ncbi:m7GpppX diphosphatase [Pancytospora epiphaga]|nr:m7GpppX diphosphatase [Pancytospora epiphaga]